MFRYFSNHRFSLAVTVVATVVGACLAAGRAHAFGGSNAITLSPADDSPDATHVGDFSGDGCSDSLTKEANQIRIYHSCTGTTRQYPVKAGVPYAYSVLGFYETNGAPGLEVLLRRPGGRLSVIDDRKATVREYVLVTKPENGGDFRLWGAGDADGEPGLELVVRMANGAIRVVHDRHSAVRSYDIPGGKQEEASIVGFWDTDGLPGDEIVLRNGRTWVVIDSRGQHVRTYALAGNYSFRGLADRDGFRGMEIVFRLPDGDELWIIDRTGRQVRN